MATAILPTHDGKLFTWQRNTGVTEASTLGMAVDGRIPNGGFGFFIKSHRTGRTLLFTRVEENKDREGELVSMTYKAAEGDFKIEIFNT